MREGTVGYIVQGWEFPRGYLWGRKGNWGELQAIRDVECATKDEAKRETVDVNNVKARTKNGGGGG